MVDLLIAFGIGTVLGAFGVLLWAPCAIKKQKKQRNDDICVDYQNKCQKYELNEECV